MKRHRTIKSKLLYCAGAIAMLFTLLIAIGRFASIDGWSGILGGILLGEDTVYSPGYSDERWRQVETGMTVEQVHSILGEPQKRWDFGDSREFGERWSYSPGDTNFRCRVLLFDGGIVKEKHQEFYFD